MTTSFSPQYLSCILDGFGTRGLTLEDISQDIELLKKIISEIKEKEFIDPSIYNWCLKHAKEIIKEKLKNKEQEISLIIKNHYQEIESINQKINIQTSLNRRNELNNQDLSRVIYLERKINHLSVVIKDKYKEIDMETDFEKVINLL